MFDGLRKKFEEVLADINPWDGGATGATVRASRMKPAPAQTIRKQSPLARPTQTFTQPKVRPLTIQAPPPPPKVAPLTMKPLSELDRFNQMDVFGQRKRMDELKGLAGRTQFNSQSDIDNRNWAQKQVQEIEVKGQKKAGNPLTFVQDLAGNAAETYNRVGTGLAELGHELSGGAQRERDMKVRNDRQDVRLIRSYGNLIRTGNPQQQAQARIALNKLMRQDKLTNETFNARQAEFIDRVDPIKQAGAIASVGLDLVTAGVGGQLLKGGVKVGTQGLKQAGNRGFAGALNTLVAPQGIKQGVKSGVTLGAGYGAANTAEMQGVQATPFDYAMNMATGGLIGGALGGAVPGFIQVGNAGRKAVGIQTKGERVANNQVAHDYATQQAQNITAESARNNPKVVNARMMIARNESKIQDLINRGFSPNSPDVRLLRTQNAKADQFARQTQQKAYDELYQQRYDTAFAEAQTKIRKRNRESAKSDLKDINDEIRDIVPGGTLRPADQGRKATDSPIVPADGSVSTNKQFAGRAAGASTERESQQLPLGEPVSSNPTIPKSNSYTVRKFGNNREVVTEQVSGTPVQVSNDLDTFIHRDTLSGKHWTVSESTTGLSIASGKTQNEALANAKKMIESRPDVKKVVAEQQKKFGVASKEKAPSASSATSRKASVAPEIQRNTPQSRQSQQTQEVPTTQETANRSSQQSGQQNPAPDNTARTDRTYPNDTSHIDTKQYVKELNKAQKNAQKGSSGIKEKASDFKEKFIDDLAPIEDRLNKAIKSGAQVDPKDHITYQLDRSRRSEGIMNAYISDNGLDKVIQNAPDTKEFDQYLIARHAKELDESITTGRDPAKDAALVRQLEGKYGEYAKEVYKYNQKLLDTSVEYGLISKATAQKLKKQYPEYVPFNRIFNEDELANLYSGAGKGNASISKQTAVQKLKGSKRAISSPLNSIIDKTRVVIEQGERNKAAKMLVSYKDLPGNPFNLKEIPASETIGTRHTVSYLDKGVKRTYEVDKEIADAAKNMTHQDIGLWGRIAAVPARVLRGGATTVNVGFAGANVVKDIVGAAINSKHPFRIADPENFGKALASALRHNGKNYTELMREGVAGTSFDMYRNPLKMNVNEIRSHKNIGTRALHNVTHPGQWYRTLENTIGRSEDFGRALQYYSNKKGFAANAKTADSANILAADQARHNSTNFFRHGSAGRGINLAIPYWNAGVQGARIQARRIKERPVQTLAKIGFAIAAPSAMIAVNNYSNDKNRQVMESIPDYEKDGNIIIVSPDAKLNEKTGKWDGVFKIPVPPQHIGIHKTIQDAVASAYTGKAFDIAGNLGSIAENYTTINPTDIKATANRYTPQGLKLIAEPMTNTNFFTGNKIVPDSQKNLPAADQYSDYTSGTAKVAGKLTGLSPRQIDNAIRTGAGGAGQNLVNLLDNGLAAAGLIDKKEIKGKTLIDSVIQRFYGAASINPTDAADDKFNDLKKQVISTDAYKGASQYDKSRMLNRLESDINDVSWFVSGKSDKETKLTTKQKSLLVDGFNVDNYTNLDKELNESYTDKYKSAQDEWDKESANWSVVQKAKKKDELDTLRVQKDFDKDTVDLYGMSKGDVYNLVSTDKNGKEYVDKILKYGDALVAAGLTDKNKYRDKYGNVLLNAPGTKSGRGRRKGGGRGGRSSKKGKFDYKLFGFAQLGKSNSKQLYDLVEQAVVKRTKKKSKAIKT